MIIATRIPSLTEQMRAATLRAAAPRREPVPVDGLLQCLKCRSYRVAPRQRAA